MVDPVDLADLTIPARYCGPSESGNGGFTAGCLAERMQRQVSGASPLPDAAWPVVEVTLRQPPPLDAPMKVRYVEQEDGSTTSLLLFGGSHIAEARFVDDDLEPVPEITLPAAQQAMAGFRGFDEHPFPSCFSCGPNRAEGDGLRIFPGPHEYGGVASAWVPHRRFAESTDLRDKLERVGLGTTWAALDCVGGWSTDMSGRRMVLGRMIAKIDTLPLVGEPHVVVGEGRGSQGRKTYTASTLYDSDGRIVGRAQHVWISVDTGRFG